MGCARRVLPGCGAGCGAPPGGRHRAGAGAGGLQRRCHCCRHSRRRGACSPPRHPPPPPPSPPAPPPPPTTSAREHTCGLRWPDSGSPFRRVCSSQCVRLLPRNLRIPFVLCVFLSCLNLRIPIIACFRTKHQWSLRNRDVRSSAGFHYFCWNCNHNAKSTSRYASQGELTSLGGDAHRCVSGCR